MTEKSIAEKYQSADRMRCAGFARLSQSLSRATTMAHSVRYHEVDDRVPLLQDQAIPVVARIGVNDSSDECEPAHEAIHTAPALEGKNSNL